MIDLASIRDIIAIFSFVIGLTYYVMVLRNQQKNQKHAEETRKIQLVLNINQNIATDEATNWDNILDMEWTDYEDFISKYGAKANPDLARIRLGIWKTMNASGMLLKDGLIDISTYVNYVGDASPIIWNKFKPIIEKQRILFDNPEHYFGIEYLAQETDIYRKSKGLKQKKRAS